MWQSDSNFSCPLRTAVLSPKCQSGSSLNLIFPALRLSNNLTAVRAGTSTTRGIFSVFFGFVQQETCIWYHTICTVVFVVLGGTKLRPTAGAEVLIRKSTTLQNVLWLCASVEDESCAISSWPSNATSAVNISLIGRRNCLMAEPANSLSAVVGPELSITRNPIANLASD